VISFTPRLLYLLGNIPCAHRIEVSVSPRAALGSVANRKISLNGVTWRNGLYSYSGITWFESRPGLQLPRMRFFMFFLSSSRQITVEYVDCATVDSLTNSFQFIIHLPSYHSTVNNVATDSHKVAQKKKKPSPTSIIEPRSSGYLALPCRIYRPHSLIKIRFDIITAVSMI
jgi:hypothetical protein